MAPLGSTLLLVRGSALHSEIRAGLVVAPVCFNQDVKALVPNAQISPKFLTYSLLGRADELLKLVSSAGNTAGVLDTRLVQNLKIWVPSVPEQSVIATALCDVDALLNAQHALIAKKRALKQGAMQEMLTGKRRLPGFSGEWAVKPLAEIAEISPGINKPLSQMGSGALYVTVQDLYDGTKIRTERLSRILVSPSEIEHKSLKLGDIILGKSSVKRDGIGYPSQFCGCDEPVVFSGFAYRVRARPGIADANYLFYGLRSADTRRWVIDNSQASALTNINKTIADAIPVALPSLLSEQTAIAQVLSDMDTEITALETQWTKTAQLKQGMMQALLTGRIRLV